MNSIIKLSDFQKKQDQYIKKAENGSLFIYPTDSIYGIGAIPTEQTVQHINKVKKRKAGKHYSIIAPSFERIKQHFKVKEDIEQERAQRTQEHGPITVLCPKKKSDFLSCISANELVGIRYLKTKEKLHPIQKFVTALKQPFITTSMNISGEPFITEVQQIDKNKKQERQKQNIDLSIIDA